MCRLILVYYLSDDLRSSDESQLDYSSDEYMFKCFHKTQYRYYQFYRQNRNRMAKPI